MEILDKLDYLMKINGLNRHSLAVKSGIPYTTIDGWYKKGYNKMRLESLKNLSAFFHVTLNFWDEENEFEDSEFLDFIPYLAQADETTLDNIRAILGMPRKKKICVSTKETV